MTNALSYLLAVLLLSGIAYAAAGDTLAEHANERLQLLVTLLYSIAVPIALGLIVFAGVVYSGGQAFDKATREKAKTWSTSIIIGAAIGILIIVLAPFAVSFIVAMGAT